MKNPFLKQCFTALLLTSLQVSAQVPKLNSFAAFDTIPTIFLDFDGQTVQSVAWQSGNAFVCTPSGLNNTQITEVFNRVSEDYRPFGVNITTDSAKFLLAPVDKRIRIIVTATSAWFPNVGGISYTNSFTWGDDIPGFVFADRLSFNPKNISECCTHESGHALGLSHQSKYNEFCTLTQPYHTGAGSGETGWAPVMGNSYGKNMTCWNDGPTPADCSLMQDNLSIITQQNGFTYRVDDFGNALNSSTINLNPVSFEVSGLISTPTDKDAFKLVLTQSGPIHFEAAPYHLGPNNEGANLDIMILMYNDTGLEIRRYNPLGTMSITADTTLGAGTYFFAIAGAGNNNTTNYGSLGSYTFTGFRGALPIHNVSLRGSNVKSGHLLTWQVTADEPIASQDLEVSENAVDFRNIFHTGGVASSYTNSPSAPGTLFYRLRVTSTTGQTMASNITAVKSTGTDKAFTVATFTLQNISVNAPENFSYTIYDANGRNVGAGRQPGGSATLNTERLPKGMYVLQLMSEHYKQTERIIKQ